MARILMVPKRFVYLDRQGKGTRAVRDDSGRFQGREVVPGTGDRTPVVRVKRDLDINHDGRIDVQGGTIRGRGHAFVRGSGTRRAFERTLT